MKSELRLVEACAAGSRSAWKELLRLQEQGIRSAAAYGLARACGRADPADVDDVTQIVLASLCADKFRRLREFRGQSRLATWLAVIAVRTAYNFARSRARSDPKRGFWVDAVPPAAVSRQEMDEVLRPLPPAARAAVRMHYLEGLSHAEIAEILGLSPNSISSLLFRALRTIRSCLSRTP